MNATIKLKALAAVVLCASKEDTRYYLNGVLLQVEPRAITYVATDGHKLFAYRDEFDKDDPDNTLLGDVIIPAASCKAFKLKKWEQGKAVLSGEALSGKLSLTYDETTHGFNPIDGVFPDWRRVLPGSIEEPRHHVNFNWDYMATLSKIGDMLDLGKAELIPNGNGPAWVRFREDIGFGVIMPMRGHGASLSAPDWLSSNEVQQKEAA